MAYSAKKSSGKISHYHRYFEGYSDIPRVTPNGATKIEKVYTAPYWVHDMTDEEWKRQKNRFGILTLAAVALYILAAFMPLGHNHAVMVIVPGGLTLAEMIFFLISIGGYLTNPRNMTIYQYKQGSGTLRRWSLILAVSMAVTALMTLIYPLINSDPQWLAIIGCAGCDLFAAAAVWKIYKTECTTAYCEEENDSGYGVSPRPFF